MLRQAQLRYLRISGFREDKCNISPTSLVGLMLGLSEPEHQALWKASRISSRKLKLACANAGRPPDAR